MPTPERTVRSLWLPVTGMVVAIVVLLWVAPLEQLGSQLGAADPWLVGAAMGVSVLHRHLLGAEKWRLTLGALGMPLGFRTAMFVWLGSYPLRELLPLRSGDLAKAAYLWRREGWSFDRLVSTLAFDRASNVLGVFTILVVGLAGSTRDLPLAIAPLPVLVATALVLLLVSARFRAVVLWPFGRLGRRVARTSEGLLAAWREIPGASKAVLTGLGVIHQASKVMILFLLLRAVGVEVPLGTLALLTALTTLATNTPVTIGGIGTREASIMLLFAPYGPPATLLAAAVLYTMCELIPPMLAAAPFTLPFLAALRSVRGGSVHVAQ
jgi:uncharacterized membrane protein YbhN (UPF0104 family)